MQMLLARYYWALSKPVHILQLGSQVRSIFNMVLIAVIDAQIKCTNKKEIEEQTSSGSGEN